LNKSLNKPFIILAVLRQSM